VSKLIDYHRDTVGVVSQYPDETKAQVPLIKILKSLTHPLTEATYQVFAEEFIFGYNQHID